jgi:tetratricopeptide (TPR) repeat protein
MVSSGLISSGQYETAAALLARLPIATQTNPMQLAGAIEQLMMLDDPASALRWLDIADAQGVRLTMLSFLRGNAHKFLGDLARSAEAYEDALRIDPNNAHAHLALASLDLEVGRERASPAWSRRSRTPRRRHDQRGPALRAVPRTRPGRRHATRVAGARVRDGSA